MTKTERKKKKTKSFSYEILKNFPIRQGPKFFSDQARIQPYEQGSSIQAQLEVSY